MCPLFPVQQAAGSSRAVIRKSENTGGFDCAFSEFTSMCLPRDSEGLIKVRSRIWRCLSVVTGSYAYITATSLYHFIC
jgi:hypothetical protein